MKITRTACVVGVTALLSLTAACGGIAQGTPEEAAASYLNASADNDAATTCELSLGPDGERREGDALDDCVKQAEDLIAEGEKAIDEDDDVATMVEQEIDRIHQLLEDGPSDVTIDGDDARVFYDDDGEIVELPFRKVDGKWFIDGTA